MGRTTPNAAVLVLPTPLGRQIGPVAAWVSTAGWAAAARRVVGDACIVTRDGVVGIDEARANGSDPTALHTNAAKRSRVPTLLKTALKDARALRAGRTFTVDAQPWRASPPRFVWQRHEMFETAGVDLARALGVPSVLFVPAVLVWQAEQWGVRRPGWGRWLERVAEKPALTGATLVAAGSEAVAEQAVRIGAPEGRILVTPTGVDLEVFDPQRAALDRDRVRSDLGVGDRFVVGWVGSFRGFHAADLALDAVEGIDDVALVMVGDGPERPRLEREAAARGIDAHFTGTVAHADMPAHLAALDAALVLAPAGHGFHYSPLKLAEYMAMGLPAIAPRVPQIAARARDGEEAMLVEPGDVTAIRSCLATLRDDPTLRARLATSALHAARRRWSWDHQVERVLDALASRSE